MKKLQKGINIPSDILLDSTLSSTSKILLGTIFTENSNNECLLNNEFLGGFTSLSKISCCNLITKLSEKHFLIRNEVNNYKICNKNKKRHTHYLEGFTSSRSIKLIRNDFNQDKLVREFCANEASNRKLVENMVKVYFDLGFKKEKEKLKRTDYLLIFRTCTIFKKEQVIQALEVMAKSSLIKNNFSINSIFKVSFIRNALEEKEQEDNEEKERRLYKTKHKSKRKNKLEEYARNIINFKNSMKEDDPKL